MVPMVRYAQRSSKGNWRVWNFGYTQGGALNHHLSRNRGETRANHRPYGCGQGASEALSLEQKGNCPNSLVWLI